MLSKSDCPIQTRISSSKDAIESMLERIEDMEIALKSQELTAEKRKEKEIEIIEIKKLLTTNRDQLEKLHKENSKSFLLTACLVFVVFLVYGIYVLIYGP